MILITDSCTMLWTNSLEKILVLGKIEGRRRRGQQRMRCLDGITDSVDMNLGKLWEMVRDREAWYAVIHGIEKSWIWFGDWMTDPVMKRTSFLVLVLEGLAGLHRTVQLQRLWHWWLGHRRLLWHWMVCLGNELRSFFFFSFCRFWDYTHVLHFRLSLLIMMANPFLLMDSCPQ